jgi:hypothetical protein
VFIGEDRAQTEPLDYVLLPPSKLYLNQPGQADIQSDLFYDYRTNVDAYPKWQA